LLPVSDGVFQFGHPDRDPLAQRGRGFLGFKVEQLPAQAPFEVGEFVLDLGQPRPCRGDALGVGGVVEGPGPVPDAIRAE
jgi:hypothetical protein